MPSPHEAIQCGSSQACTMDGSNMPSHSERSGQYDIVQSILSNSSAAEGSLGCSDRNEEPEAESPKPSDSVIESKSYEMSSPQREDQSSPIAHTNPTSSNVPCMPLAGDQDLPGSSLARESSSTTSVAIFAFDRDKSSDNGGRDPSPGAEAEEFLGVEDEPDPSETSTAQEGNEALKRTPLPNGRAKLSSSPVASPARPKLPTPLRVTKRGSKWSAQEVTLLRRLKGDGMSWEHISTQLPGRSATACRRHYAQSRTFPPAEAQSVSASAAEKAPQMTPSAAAARMRKKRWSTEEIDELNHLKDADVQWPDIAEQLPGRTVAACLRKWENLRKEARMLSAARQSALTQDRLIEAAEKENFESSGGEEETLDEDIEEQRPKRDIIEMEYSSSSSDEEMSDSDVGDQELEGEMRDESSESQPNRRQVGSVSEEDMPDRSSDEDSSESESESVSEDELERKRKHAMFFLKR